MAFGQSSGPPASAKQVQELLSLVHAAGHADFRDARGPLGLTQRQAAGKFTRDEAEAFIEQLQRLPDQSGETPTASTPPARGRAASAPASTPALRRVPSEQLAAELQRRGWIVVEP